MRISLSTLLTALLFVFFLTPAAAQIRTPSASPGAKMETTVGLTDVALEYSRPSMKGRKIFAESGLVPFGEIWRTGANQATKVSFGDAVMIDGNKVDAGSYAVLTKPTASEWTIMFFPYEGGSWNSYVEKDPAVTVMAKPMKLNHSVETFSMGIDNVEMNAAHLTMAWEDTKVAVPFTVEVQDKVMANIERVMAGPSANDYYQAATFIHDAGVDNKKALEYIQKANTMMENPRYWMVRREAVILADLGMKTEAVDKAKKSMMLAKEAGNMDYVRMNEKSIKEWNR